MKDQEMSQAIKELWELAAKKGLLLERLDFQYEINIAGATRYIGAEIEAKIDGVSE